MSEFILGLIVGLLASIFFLIWVVSDTYYKSQGDVDAFRERKKK